MTVTNNQIGGRRVRFATDASGNVTGLVGPMGEISFADSPYYPITVNCASSATTTANGSNSGIGDVIGEIDLTVNTPGATATISIRDGATGTTYTLYPTGGWATAGFYTLTLGYTAVIGAWDVTCGAGCTAVAKMR